MTRAATAAADAASGGNKTSHHSSSSHVAPVSGLQVRTLEVTDSSQCSFCLGHRYMPRQLIYTHQLPGRPVYIAALLEEQRNYITDQYHDVFLHSQDFAKMHAVKSRT